MVKNILDLKYCSAPNLAAGLSAAVTFGDVKRSPILNSFIREFEVDPDQAIQELTQQTGVGANDSAIIAHLLFKIQAILYAHIDKFGFSDVRVDHALHIFFPRSTSPIKQNTRRWRPCSRASRAGGSNDSTAGFDKEQCHHLPMRRSTLGTYTKVYPPPSPTLWAWFQRYTIKEELLEDIYEAIRQERLLELKDFSGHRGLEVQVTGSISPMHFTVRVKSELIHVRVAESDANFRIHLLGQGLLFNPPTLHFPKSNEATSRVIGTAISMTSIVYWRAGANAHIYSMPLACSIAVERKHMRNTVQIGFDPLDAVEKEVKQYVFSVEGTNAGSKFSAPKLIVLRPMLSSLNDL